MGYREDEKRWKRIQEMLAAEASGKVVRPAVSQRTLFGIPSTVEQVIERTVAEDERMRRAKRKAKNPERAAVGRLAFLPLCISDGAAIERMSSLASGIVKEHFDSIIGPDQNDYMIERFQSVEALRSQLAEGYQYYFIQLATDAVDEAGGGRDIGFLAYVAHADSLYISKFYLAKPHRGNGYAREMLAFVASAAEGLGYDAITLNVNRNNDARLAYEKMGFRIIREEVNDIGEGFVMDDYVYQLDIADAPPAIR